jgi:hypothetical protein
MKKEPSTYCPKLLSVGLIIYDEGSKENRPSTFTGHVNTETPLASGIAI